MKKRNIALHVELRVIVNTTMRANLPPPWDGETRIAIGKALTEVEVGVGVTAAELEAITGKHQSNVKKAAEELVEAGALLEVSPPVPTGQPGRRPQTAFAFAEGARDDFEAVLDSEPVLSFPLEGAHLVFVDVETSSKKLWEVLSQPGLAPSAQHAVQLEGDPVELMFSFEGPNARAEAMDLSGAFREAELKVRRQTVATPISMIQLRKEARRRVSRSERSRNFLASMQTTPLESALQPDGT